MKIIRGANITFIPSAHEDKNHPGVFKKILLTKSDLVSGNIQMINWSLLPKGSAFRRHFHQDMAEVFILMEGETRITVDDKDFTLGKGDAVIINAHEVHRMENIGKSDVYYLVIGITQGSKGKTIVVKNEKE